jgi:RHS repeat-associated protein
MYSMGGQLLFDENHRVAGTRASDYVYLSGSLLATYERNYSTGLTEFKYQHTDALGSPVAVTNQSAQVIERTNYEPYGNVIGRANNDKPGYTGHVMDSATGLTYMQQRYYDPTIGRFLSVDPIAVDTKLAGNFGRYDYANNNPYKFIDPDGRAGILYWTSPNTVVYTVRYNMHGETPQFTRAQFEAQVRADFSGSVNINGRTVTIRAQAIASNGNGPLVNNVNVVRDTAGVTTSGRSETNRIGGNQVTLGATGRDAASAATASHEVGGHGGGAGDQYAGGVAVGGNRLQSDVPGPSNVMKDLQGNPANQQTLKEIIQAPTNLNGCARGVHAATGGC